MVVDGDVVVVEKYIAVGDDTLLHVDTLSIVMLKTRLFFCAS